jgi:hypothetical protein
MALAGLDVWISPLIACPNISSILCVFNTLSFETRMALVDFPLLRPASLFRRVGGRAYTVSGARPKACTFRRISALQREIQIQDVHARLTEDAEIAASDPALQESIAGKNQIQPVQFSNPATEGQTRPVPNF